MNLKAIRKIRDKVCKGCSTYEFGLKFSSPCNVPHKQNGHHCPCSTCLIKGICTEVCDELEYYKRHDIKRINKRKPREARTVIEDDVEKDSMYQLYHPPDLFSQG